MKGEERQPVAMILSLTVILTVILVPTLSTAFVKGTNESSYQYGYKNGRQGYQTVVLVKTLVPITPTGEYLTPDSNKSAVYNSGFAQGYLGLPLKGHHTLEFLTAYKNGTGLYWLHHGED